MEQQLVEQERVARLEARPDDRPFCSGADRLTVGYLRREDRVIRPSRNQLV
jgi:hypothetical protein